MTPCPAPVQDSASTTATLPLKHDCADAHQTPINNPAHLRNTCPESTPQVAAPRPSCYPVRLPPFAASAAQLVQDATRGKVLTNSVARGDPSVSSTTGQNIPKALLCLATAHRTVRLDQHTLGRCLVFVRSMVP